MGLWVFASSVAQGSVETEDTTGCLDAGAVEFEVREIVGDNTVDKLHLLVQLSGEERWQLALTVRGQEGTIWNRIVPVEPADCPYLAEFVAQSFERGLAELPTWGLKGERLPIDLGVVLSGSLPAPTRVTGAIDAWFPLGPIFALHSQSGFSLTAVQAVYPEVGVDPAQVSYGSVQSEIGPGAAISWLRASTRLGFGVGWASGARFGASDGRTLRPRISSVTDLLIAPGPYFRAGPRLEYRALGARYTESDGTEIAREIPLRIGIVVGISGPVVIGDGRRRERR